MLTPLSSYCSFTNHSWHYCFANSTTSDDRTSQLLIYTGGISHTRNRMLLISIQFFWSLTWVAFGVAAKTYNIVPMSANWFYLLACPQTTYGYGRDIEEVLILHICQYLAALTWKSLLNHQSKHHTFLLKTKSCWVSSPHSRSCRSQSSQLIHSAASVDLGTPFLPTKSTIYTYQKQIHLPISLILHREIFTVCSQITTVQGNWVSTLVEVCWFPLLCSLLLSSSWN